MKRTADLVEGTTGRYSGDHLQALARSLARRRLREQRTDETSVEDVENALTEFSDRPLLNAREELVVSTHECGHAVVSMFCTHTPPIERISIRGDLAGSLGAVTYSNPRDRYVVTRGQLLDQICTLFGGREAELVFLDDLSLGSAADLERATDIARALVEEFGMGGDGVGVRRVVGRSEDFQPSEAMKGQTEEAVREVLDEQRLKARHILEEQKALVLALRNLLLEKKVLDREALKDLAPAKPGVS